MARLGYEPYVETLEGILAHGNSSTRQRAVFAKRQSFQDIVRFNVREFCEGAPIWANKTVKDRGRRPTKQARSAKIAGTNPTEFEGVSGHPKR